MNPKCPKCQGEAESIGKNRYECPYCGEQFSEAEITNRGGNQYSSYQAATYVGEQPQNVVDDNNQPVLNQQVSQEDCGIGMKILSLLIPIVGLILYFAKKNEEPIAAKSCLNWAIAGFVITVVLGII